VLKPGARITQPDGEHRPRRPRHRASAPSLEDAPAEAVASARARALMSGAKRTAPRRWTHRCAGVVALLTALLLPVSALAQFGEGTGAEGTPSRAVPTAAPAALRPARDYRSGGSASDPADARADVDIARAELRQVDRDLEIAIQTRGSWSASDLARAGRSLCAYLSRGQSTTASDRLCFAFDRHGRLRLLEQRLDAAGSVTRSLTVARRIKRRDRNSASARVPWTSAGLRPARYRWGARASAGDASCVDPAAGACQDVTRPGVVRIKRVRLRGCRRRGAAFRTNGSRHRRLVALTFDDGPAPITPQFLTLLERRRVPATFFVLGQNVPGHQALLRRMRRDGDEIGNHSFSHPVLSGGGPAAYRQIVATSAAIDRATGFLPCEFRPPYGASSRELVSEALRLHLSTVTWDVDPRDWSLPGSGAIAARVAGAARPGSIAVMHDGGGPRTETLNALPAIIARLRRRGYHFFTISQMFGYREIWN
jgi:peptidoglycan-N-acetylglucosamine deacetylase